MAQLKDTTVLGSLRATDTLFSTTSQFQILRAPTSSNGTTFGPGSNNNLLKSNGNSVYWTTLVASDIPNLNTSKLTEGILGVARGGTGSATAGVNTIFAGPSSGATNAAPNFRSLVSGDIPTISITDKTSGTLSVARGGTGATTAENARSNLGLGSIATYGAATSGTTDTWGLVPVIGDSNGVMEVGKYIDFHTTDGNTANYDVRITASTSGLTISGTTIGTFSGNLTGNASTATKATKDANGNTISSTYLKLSGGTMTGSLLIDNTSLQRQIQLSSDSINLQYYGEDSGPNQTKGRIYLGQTTDNNSMMYIDAPSGLIMDSSTKILLTVESYLAGYNKYSKLWLTNAYTQLYQGIANEAESQITMTNNQILSYIYGKTPVQIDNGDGTVSYEEQYVALTSVSINPNGVDIDGSLSLTNALAVHYGGTGATTATAARTNLGLGSAATYNVMPAGNSAFSSTESLIPTIAVDGGMEVGKYIDFHVDTTAEDYDIRLTASTTGLTINKDLIVQGLINNFKLVVDNTALNANDIRTTTGFWSKAVAITNAATTNHGAILGIGNVGTPCQYFFPDANLYIYKRYYTNSAWTNWARIYAGYADSAGTATKATQDGNGANIASTYLKMNTAEGIASCGGSGQNNYYKIATITITTIYINRPIAFEISGRDQRVSLLQVMFANSSSTDPGLSSFTTNDNSLFWIKKTATSTWEIYGKYSGTWGDACIHRITGNGAGIGVTINMTNAGTSDSIISEATRASYEAAAYLDLANISQPTIAKILTAINESGVNNNSTLVNMSSEVVQLLTNNSTIGYLTGILKLTGGNTNSPWLLFIGSQASSAANLYTFFIIFTNGSITSRQLYKVPLTSI